MAYEIGSVAGTNTELFAEQDIANRMRADAQSFAGTMSLISAFQFAQLENGTTVPDPKRFNKDATKLAPLNVWVVTNRFKPYGEKDVPMAEYARSDNRVYRGLAINRAGLVCKMLVDPDEGTAEYVGVANNRELVAPISGRMSPRRYGLAVRTHWLKDLALAGAKYKAGRGITNFYGF